MVRTPLVILLCFIFFTESMFPDIELSDISVIPNLFLHFQEHKRENPGITFLSFLALHYGDSGHLDQDAKKHTQLPFRNRHHHFITFQALQNSFAIDASHDYDFLMVIEGVAYAERPLRLITTTIWQPPRA